MVIVQDIINLMESLSPPALKQDWDNVGLNCGSRNAEVKKVLIALDPFEHVCKEAADWGADLLLTHHPLLFRGLNAVTDENSVSRSLMVLVQNKISHFCAHTNLDSTAGGVNDVLAETLGLSHIVPIAENPSSMLRCGDVQEQSLTDFLETVKEKLNAPGLRYCDSNKPVRKVAVGGGSCAGGMLEALHAGCDTFVTADVKYNQFWDAYELGLNIIDAGHFYTENPIVAILAQKISATFPEIEVKISESHADCMKYY